MLNQKKGVSLLYSMNSKVNLVHSNSRNQDRFFAINCAECITLKHRFTHISTPVEQSKTFHSSDLQYHSMYSYCCDIRLKFNWNSVLNCVHFTLSCTVFNFMARIFIFIKDLSPNHSFVINWFTHSLCIVYMIQRKRDSKWTNENFNCRKSKNKSLRIYLYGDFEPIQQPDNFTLQWISTEHRAV